jgi:hypothetical protein
MMLKTLVTDALIVTASSLPGIAQVGPGLGRSDSIASSPQSYAQVCTNDIDGRLSVRSGPGRPFPKLGEIPNGQIVGLISGQYQRDGFWWWRIIYGTRSAWVRADYLCGDPQ